MSFYEKLIGQSLATCDEEQQKVGPVTGIPMLGLDALSSAAYGPEAALTILLPLGAVGVSWIGPLTVVILALLAILYASYRQTLPAYPNGGERVAMINVPWRLKRRGDASLVST